jgi:hypothetical protein
MSVFVNKFVVAGVGRKNRWGEPHRTLVGALCCHAGAGRMAGQKGWVHGYTVWQDV